MDRKEQGTEARELPGYSFAVRHFILRRVTNPKENVAVSTLTLWVDDAVARLVLRAKEGQVSATEAAEGDMADPRHPNISRKSAARHLRFRIFSSLTDASSRTYN